MNIYYRKRQKAKGEGSTKKVSKNWLFSVDGSQQEGGAFKKKNGNLSTF